MTRFRYRHIQSTVENREPSSLLDGEIAVNRFEGKEKLFILNSNNEIASFSSDGQIDSKLADKLNVSAFTAYSGAVDTTINSKASQTDLNTLSGTVTGHTASTNIHLTTTEKTNIDSLATNIAAISGITSTKVGNWDTAYTNNHTHSNKSALDSITGNVGTMAYQAASSYSSATQVNTALGDKVDKVSGKGLSTNDYTTDEKDKLSGIASGAEVNVQANWTENDTTSDSYIQNKPTLGTAAAKGVSNGISNTDNLIESKHIYSGVGVTVSYDSSTHYIQLKSTSGNVLSSFDASAFLVDGMVDSVTLESKSGTTYLVITWNTATGKEKTELNIGDIFEADNYYTKNDLTGATTTVKVKNASISDSANSVALSNVSGADDLKAIEALTGTSGLLKKTAANTWALDTTSYSSATEVNTALAGKSNTGHTHDDRYYTESELTGSSTTVVVAKASSATTAASANSVAWDNVSGKPDTYTPSAHNQASNTITAMTSYTKPSSTSAIATSDSLNTAIGKLEKGLDTKANASDLDGVKLKRITQVQYDTLTTKDSNTLYIITD